MQNLKSGLFLLFGLVIAINTSQAQFFSQKQPDLLPEQDAFKVTASINEQGAIEVLWSIADGYYMYRDQFSVSTKQNNLTLDKLSLPKGQIEDDPEFGEVEVYFFNAVISTQLLTNTNNSKTLTLELKGQGCNKPVGVCYPPLNRTINLDIEELNAQETVAKQTITSNIETSSDAIPATAKKSFLAYIIAAFGAGILLSFTPCVLPMIPILAGIIAGQNQPSKMRSGWLAICYVAGTIITYISAGAIAGATGAQLQAYFQHPYVIGFICLLLALLALSLFGVFKIQLPSHLQTKLNTANTNNKSASITSFILGLISALVVGACVSPVLILALGAAISQGSPLLGASIMGSMALGMGILLIVFGFGAGWLLPKTGAWMQQVQIIFGFMVVGVAIYLLSAFDSLPLLLMWALLLISSGWYLWQLNEKGSIPLLNSISKAIASILIIWGGLCVIGFASGGKEVLVPLSELSFYNNNTPTTQLSFNKTTQLSEVNDLLKQAKQKKQTVLVDFYADWCLDCKRMHRTTFKNEQVITALTDWQLIEIDVTNTSEDSEEVKQAFGVFGPPAMLIFDPSGKELTALRQYGYMNAAQFLSHIKPAQ